MFPKLTKSYLLFGLLIALTIGNSINCFSQTKTSDGIGNWQEISWSPIGVPGPLDDVEIKNDSVIIPLGSTVTVNNLKIGNGGNLIVYGNLIVKGSAEMKNTSIGFTMGPSSTVVIYKDFTINNQVELSLSSYLVIYGNFTNSGSSNQGELNIAEASIYVYGEVSGGGFPASFGCTEEYSGTTPDVEETCDYGNEADFEENQDTIPPEIVDLLNCFDLSTISDQEVCPGQTATFSVDYYNNVTYQWQVSTNTEPTIWSNIGNDSNEFTIVNSSISQNGNKYRVVVTPTDAVDCKISISRNVILSVLDQTEWTGNTNTDWNTVTNWSCGYIPDLTSNVLIPEGLTNYPVISIGPAGMVRNITIDNNASLEILSNTLQIKGLIISNGDFNASLGTIEILGTNAIDIPVNTFRNDQIQNLTISNIAGVNLLGSTKITGTLLLKNGNLISNGNLTLISNGIQTALIDGSGTGEVIGEVRMQRYLDNSFGYKYFSSPFNNTIVDDFSIYVDLQSTFPHVYSYNENREDGNSNDASGWEAYDTASNSFNILEGYAMNFGNSSDGLTVEITGEVNNGDFSRRLQNNNGFYTKGYSLAGNPYPSPIDWDATSGWTKQNIDDALYFFNASTDDQYTGTYTSYVNGISSNGSSSASIIPSMQGFFVKVSDGFTSGTLGVTNEVRTNNFTQQFYRDQEENIEKNDNSLIRLIAGFDHYDIKDAMVIYFSPYTLEKFEKDKDAFKLMNTNLNVPSLYSLDPDGKKLSVNGIQNPNSSGINRIPLGIKTERSGWVSIMIQDLQGFGSGMIYLVDKTNQTKHNLRSNEKFRVRLEKGAYNDRFEILFSEGNIQESDVIFKDLLSVTNLNGIVSIKTDLNEMQKGVLRTVSITGQIIETREVIGEESFEIKGIKSSGMYFIILTTEQEKYTKKVLIKL